MNYQQALQHKKDILKSLEELRTFSYSEIMILPSKAEDLEKYLEEYKKNPESFNDETCLHFSSDNNFMVYRISGNRILNCRQGKI